MNADKIITYLAIAIIIISLLFIGIKITGYSLVETGIVNVTIETSASIIFETSLLDLGNGTVTTGQTATVGSEPAINDQWSGTQRTGELILENNGNINVSFTLKSNKSAQDFLGGVSPTFKLKVTNNGTESASCSTFVNFTSYTDVNTTEQAVCSNLGKDDTNDSVMIDAQITISDSAAGTKTVLITATATPI